MSGHKVFRGVYVDHLYRDCPSLARGMATGSTPCCQAHKHLLGTRLVGMVDPDGTDVCGLCVRRWKRKQAKIGVSP